MELAKRSWPEIVAHIPRNLGSVESLLTEPSPGRLAVLWSSCFSGLTLFGQSCRMNRPEIARQNKARQIWKIKTNEEKNYKADEAFGYTLFVTLIHPSILRLHWRHLISSC
jgi:hypothetical protein